MSQCNGRRYLADSFITANGVTHPRDTFKKKDSSTSVKDCRQLRYITLYGFAVNYAKAKQTSSCHLSRTK